MKFNKEDVLDALGIEQKGFGMSEALIGFGVGALVGAAVALMLAPKKGTDLREDLMGRARDIIGKAKEGVGMNRADDMIGTEPRTY